MKTILIVLASLLAHTLAGEEVIRDPFAEEADEPAGWPKRLAPSEKHLKRFDEPVLKSEGREGVEGEFRRNDVGARWIDMVSGGQR